MRWGWFGAAGFVAATLAQAAAAPAPAPSADPQVAARRGLALVQRGAERFAGTQTCFSCHHQATALFVCAQAGQSGVEFDRDRHRKQVDFTVAYFASLSEEMRKGKGVQGSNDAVAAALAAFAENRQPPDATTESMAQFLLKRQLPDGSWFAAAERPPSEGSFFASTALALMGLRAYCPKDRQSELPDILSRAAGWLRKSRTVDTEDMVWQVRGLKAAGDDAGARKAAQALRAAQRRDGGWAQLPRLQSDAYATGTALLALAEAGAPPTDEAWQKGIVFLLRTQEADGSWLVKSRAVPQQTFFDNGDPHGRHQFISFAATGYATMALLRAQGEVPAAAALTGRRPSADRGPAPRPRRARDGEPRSDRKEP